jgi:hypothetical protein
MKEASVVMNKAGPLFEIRSPSVMFAISCSVEITK